MLVNTVDLFHESLTKFTESLTIDCETTGLAVWQHDRLCGVGVCTDNEETFYYPFRHIDNKTPLISATEADLNLPIELLPVLFKKIQEAKTLKGHNIKFDLTAMRQDGFELPDDTRLIDTMVMSRLCFHDNYSPLDLESVVDVTFPNEHASDWKVKFKQHVKAIKAKSYAEVHPVDIAPYCEKDCLMTHRIFPELLKYIEETGQTRVYEQEMELIPVVWKMECEGLYFDREYVVQKIEQLYGRIAELEKDICTMLGVTINVGSTMQLTKALNDMGIYSPKKTKAGKQSWDNDALKKLGHAIGAKILSYRSFQKMIGTYLEPALKWQDDRLHPNLNQHRAVTGRFSCSNPNLQNLINGSFVIRPKAVDREAMKILSDSLLGGAGELADEFAGLMATSYTGDDNEVAIKRMFIPPDGYELWAFDFNQMEMRGFADYIKDPVMNDLLENKHFDFHKFVAQTVWGAQPGTPQWKQYRKIAKAINFGLIFCVGDEKLGLKIQKTTEEAGTYKRDYFARFPNANLFIQNVINTVKQRGYVFNRFGRRYVIDSYRAYVGINYLIQGSCADIVKNRMIAVAKKLKERKALTKMVVQVHDELLFYIHKSELDWAPAMIKDTIEERQIKTFLPVTAERGNPSWVEKVPMCVYCLKQLTKEEDSGDAVHPCDEIQRKRRVQVA